MNISEIKAAIDAGQIVHWSHTGYVVSRDNAGQYLITYTRNGSTIGLTNKAGTKLNGNEGDFFIAEPSEPVVKCCWMCLGTNVQLDAWLAWDLTLQTWTFAPKIGSAVCNDCDIETVIVERPASERNIPEAETESEGAANEQAAIAEDQQALQRAYFAGGV